MNDWEFEYNGLTFGGATNYQLAEVEGLHPPDSREDIDDKAEDHGAYVYAKYLHARRMVFQGDVLDDGVDFEALVTAWRAAFVPQESPQPLTFKIPGDGDITKVIYCIPTKRHFPVNPEYSGRRYTLWSLEFVAEDPRIYNSETSSAVISIGATNGVVFDVVFDMNFGGGGIGQAAADNQGIFSTWPRVRIEGPVTNPRIRNVTTGKQMRLLTTIVAGSYIDIDFAAKTVMLEGSASRYGSIDFDTSTWWELQQGQNTIGFDGSDSDGATNAVIYWQDAWI